MRVASRCRRRVVLLARAVVVFAALLPVAAVAVIASQQPPAPTPSPAGVQTAQPPASVRPDPQMPPVTFKVEVNYVEVDAYVTDAKGNFVPDLKKEDFQILEDGKPQNISTFGRVYIPLEVTDRPLLTARAVEPDVQTNERAYDGRVFMIVLDDLHTYVTRSSLVKKAVDDFIQHNIGDNDFAAVVFTSGAGQAQDFTTNRRLLVQSVDRFMGKKLRSATLNKLDVAHYQQQNPTGTNADRVTDPEEQQRIFNARNTLDTLSKLSDWMAGVRGRRKALIFVSEGIDYNFFDMMSSGDPGLATGEFQNQGGGEILDAMRSMIAAATRANVSLYAIDPRGIATGADETMELTGVTDQDLINYGPNAIQDEIRAAQDSLRTLAEQTGGFASVNNNDFSRAFRRIVDENSSYYVLGYYPGNEKRDGRLRKLDVRVTRPGLTVRARKGYIAPKGKPPAAATEVASGTSAVLKETLSSPLPVSGLGLRVFAAPFRGVEPKASVPVVVQADGRSLKFAEKDGKAVANIEISYLAIDEKGKIAGGDRKTVNMTLKPETRAIVAQNGLRMLNRLELSPGKYQLRVAAYEEGALSGSVYYDVEVPEFTKAPLTLSGIVLTAASAGRMPTLGKDEDLQQALPGPPTADRTFGANDQLALLAEVYDNRGSQAHKVTITTTVRTEEGRVVFKHDDERSSSELQGARGGYGVSARIPLSTMASGLYVLKVEARSSLSGNPTAAREAVFRIQ